MAENKMRVPITLTEEQHAALQEAATELGLTISSFIRMKALEALRKQGEQ